MIAVLPYVIHPKIAVLGRAGGAKVQDTPSFLLLHRFSSSDYAELTEHSCFTDYARNLNGFGLAAIGLAPYRLACNCPIMAGFFQL